MPNQKTKRSQSRAGTCPPKGNGPGRTDPKFEEHNKQENSGGRSVKDDVKDDAKEVANQTRQKAKELKDSVKQQASEAAEVTGQKAKEQAQHMKEAGERAAREQKDHLADEVEAVGAAAHQAAQAFREEDEAFMARYADRAAEGIDRMSRYLRDREPRQLLHDAEELSRSRPELMFGGLFIAGLGLARFLKASGARRRQTGDDSVPATVHQTGERTRPATVRPESDGSAPATAYDSTTLQTKETSHGSY